MRDLLQSIKRRFTILLMIDAYVCYLAISRICIFVHSRRLLSLLMGSAASSARFAWFKRKRLIYYRECLTRSFTTACAFPYFLLLGILAYVWISRICILAHSRRLISFAIRKEDLEASIVFRNTGVPSPRKKNLV